MQTKLLRVLAVLLAITLFAACGSDDDDDPGASDEGPESTEAPEGEGAAGGDFIDLGTVVGDPLEHIDPALNSTLDGFQVINATYDGLTDITVAPFFEMFDKQYPGSKFILTVRDRESWLRSCQNHWFNRPAFKEAEDPDEETHYLMRQFLRSSVFGCYNFVPERFVWVYEQYVKRVMDYFKDRPEDLLVINVCEGEGYEKLAPFLNRPLPTQPFPHKGNVLSQRIAQERAKIRARLELAG